MCRQLPNPSSPVGIEGLAGGPVTSIATGREGDRVRLEPPRVGGRAVPAAPGRKVRLQYRRLKVPCVALGVIVEGPGDDGVWVEVHSVERLQRRSAVRVPVQMQVEITLPAPRGEEPVTVTGVSEDLSAGGMLVRTREELERGWLLRLRFCLPGEDACFTTRGRVVHGSEDERRTERRWRAGIEFLGVEFEDREHLVRYTLWREREIRRREVGLDPIGRPPGFGPWRAPADTPGPGGDGSAG